MDCPFITFLCFLRKTPIRNYEIDALNPNKWFLKLAMTLFPYHPFILCVPCVVLLLKFALKYKSYVQYSHKIYITEKGFVNSFLRMKTSFPSLLVREKSVLNDAHSCALVHIVTVQRRTYYIKTFRTSSASIFEVLKLPQERKYSSIWCLGITSFATSYKH